MADDGDAIVRQHLPFDEAAHRVARADDVAQIAARRRLVEEEEQQPFFVIDLERRAGVVRIEERAARVVVDAVDRSFDAVLADDEVLRHEAEDLIAVGVDDDCVEQDDVDVDALAELRGRGNGRGKRMPRRRPGSRVMKRYRTLSCRGMVGFPRQESPLRNTTIR